MKLQDDLFNDSKNHPVILYCSQENIPKYEQWGKDKLNVEVFVHATQANLETIRDLDKGVLILTI